MNLLQIEPFYLSYAFDVIYALLLLIGGWLLTAWGSGLINARLQGTRHIDQTLRPIIVSFLRYVAFGVIAIAALAKFGIQTTSVLAVIGATGLAIALALQSTLSNVASGVMLLVLRPFSVGDYVDCEGASGTVREIGLFVTEFETADGLYIMVPNSQLFGRPVKNYSRFPYRRIEIKLRISYDDEIDHALRTARDVIKGDERVVSVKPVEAVVSKLGENSVELALRCWTEREHYWAALYDLQKAVKDRFDAEGIRIPAILPDTRGLHAKAAE